MRKTILFIVLCTIIITSGQASAEEQKAKSMDELSKEMANPLAQIWNLSFQSNFTTLSGDSLDGHERINTTLFQPVLPVPLGDTWTAFARPVITYVTAPTKGHLVGGTPSNPIITGDDKKSDLGDLILPMGVGIAKKTGWSWGGGFTFIFPTSQHDLLASHQYQAGPTALLLWANDNWMIGGHIQHWWGIADDSDNSTAAEVAHTQNLNHTDLQYFIIRHLPNAWQLRASPHVKADWERDFSNRWTVPIALGIGKMIKIGPMPVMLMAEYQHNLIAPDGVGEDYTIMLQANFIIKNPFGSM